MKERYLIFGLVAFTAAASFAQGLRKPVWAGQFYEADRARLSAQLDAFLAAATPNPPAGDLKAIIVPHAGYVYSGPVAAWGYKLLPDRDYETVVILGPSHRVGFDGASIWPEGGFATPLGTAEVDADAARTLARATGFRFRPEAQAEEHSVEVQVPWIQKTLPRAKIVPVVLGVPEETMIRTMAAALAELGRKKKILVVASTDMSHFLDKKDANALDAKTIDFVRERKTASLMRQVVRGENVLCGGAGVIATLFYAEACGSPEVSILRYGDSADAGAPDDRVVGYFSAAVASVQRTGDRAAPEFSLSAAEKNELLVLARRTLDSFVRNGTIPPYETADIHFTDRRGAFVTLTKKGDLRGCIGYIEPVVPLFKAVQQCAVYAASEDPRFSPIASAELPDIAVEISVLTPARRIDDPRRVVVGKHGLIMSRDGRHGVLLPQVAVENGWGREEFLAQACLKAGLPPDAWKKGAEISVFEAIVFH